MALYGIIMYTELKKNTLIVPIELGGLGMIDVRICNITAKGTWIRRLLGPESFKWKTLTWNMLYINCLELNKQLKSPFNTQVLNAWSEINSIEPKSLKEIIIISKCNRKQLYKNS